MFFRYSKLGVVDAILEYGLRHPAMNCGASLRRGSRVYDEDERGGGVGLACEYTLV